MDQENRYFCLTIILLEITLLIFFQRIFLIFFFLKKKYFVFLCKYLNVFILNYERNYFSSGFSKKLSYLISIHNIFTVKKKHIFYDEILVYLDMNSLINFFIYTLNILENINNYLLEVNHLYFFTNYNTYIYLI